MPTPNPDDSLLLIRCPSCGQRFKVGEDLRGRTVECGGCEHRFRIDDESVVRGRKFYPGERKAPGISHFQRVPLSGGEKMIGVQPVHYDGKPDPAVMEPMSPQRLMAGLAGVAGMALMALILMFGGGPGGLLDGMDVGARLVMAGFAAVLGVVLLVYANPKARTKSGFFGVLMAAGVIALPFFFKAGTPVAKTAEAGKTVKSISEEAEEAVKPRANTALSAVREAIGTAPLETEIARVEGLHNGRHAYGLWLRGMAESNRYLVMDYYLRVTKADPSSHPYPRDGGDYLVVITGVGFPLEELASLSAPIGEVVKIYPELSIVEVKVKNENFVEGPADKLANREDPDFYALNKRELESIDVDRVKGAVRRLAVAEPKIYRSDISRRLAALLNDPEIDFKDLVCTALLSWQQEPGVAGRAAVKEMEALSGQGKNLSPELVAVAVKEKDAGALPFIDQLWFKNPTSWEASYGDMGAMAEALLLKRFPETEGMQRYSAARLLGRVGGAASLPVLEAAAPTADSELKVILEQSRKSILGRLGR